MHKKTLIMLTLLIAGVLIVISGVAIPVVTTLVCGMGGDYPTLLTLIACGLITLLTFVALAMVNDDD